jgi:hypothetical protein
MSKVVGMLVALALFGALPAVAFAQTPPDGGDTISSGNTQDADIEQEASAGAGGNAGNQAAIVQQNAGDDAIAEINQTQNFNAGGVGHGRVHGHGGHGHGHVHGHGGRVHGVGGVGVRGVGGVGGGVGGVGGGVGGVGGGVGGVGLAVTGFDAWILALVGGAVVAGGLGLLAAQRRGRLTP